MDTTTTHTAQQNETSALLSSILTATQEIRTAHLDYSQQENLRSLDVELWNLVMDLEDTE